MESKLIGFCYLLVVIIVMLIGVLSLAGWDKVKMVLRDLFTPGPKTNKRLRKLFGMKTDKEVEDNEKN